MEAEGNQVQPQTGTAASRAQVAKERGPMAKELLAELFQRLSLPAELTLREGGEEIVLHAKMGEGAEAAGLAGDRPTMQEPIAYLLSKMVNRGLAEGGPRAYVKLTFGDVIPALSEIIPSEETDPELVALGKMLADRSKKLSKILAVGPMGARDRRSIHVAVKEVGGATTKSEGEGLLRRVLIIPEGQSVSAPKPNGIPSGEPGNRRE